MDKILFASCGMTYDRAAEIVIGSILAAICTLASSHAGYTLLTLKEYRCYDSSYQNGEDLACRAWGDIPLNEDVQEMSSSWIMFAIMAARVVLSGTCQLRIFLSCKRFASLGYGSALGFILVLCLILTAVFSLLLFTPDSFYGVELVMYLVVRRATKWCSLFVDAVSNRPCSTNSPGDSIAESLMATGLSFMQSCLRSCLIVGLGVYTLQPFSSLCLLACVSCLVVFVVFSVVFPACFSLMVQICGIPPARKDRTAGKPASACDDGVSQIQAVMMLGLAVVHAQNIFGNSNSHASALNEMFSTRKLLALQLLQRNSWWNYMNYFLQWCLCVSLICLYRDFGVAERAYKFLDGQIGKRVSFKLQPTNVSSTKTMSQPPAKETEEDVTDGGASADSVDGKGCLAAEEPAEGCRVPADPSLSVAVDSQSTRGIEDSLWSPCPAPTDSLSTGERVVFTVGQISDSDGEENTEVLTKVDEKPMYAPSVPPVQRSLSECLRIFKEVGHTVNTTSK